MIATSEAFAASLIARPLAMSADAADVAYSAYSAMGMPGRLAAAASPPFELDEDSIATIAIHGQIVSRPTWVTERLGITSYTGIRAALEAAIADTGVRGIIIDVDSPGGEVAGSTEAAAAIRAASTRKPLVAHVDGQAVSAAYVIAAGAPRVIVAPSATVG